MRIFVFGDLLERSNWSLCPAQNHQDILDTKSDKVIMTLLTMNSEFYILFLDNGKDGSLTCKLYQSCHPAQ